MANTIDIGIKQVDRKEIADGLSRLLADTYTLHLNLCARASAACRQSS